MVMVSVVFTLTPNIFLQDRVVLFYMDITLAVISLVLQNLKFDLNSCIILPGITKTTSQIGSAWE